MLPKLSFLVGLFCVTSMFIGLSSESSASCVRGHVADGSGAPLGNASITVKQLDSAQAREALTGLSGEFEICALEPGRYEVATQHDGFTGQNRIQTVTAELDTVLEMKLAPAAGNSAKSLPADSTAMGASHTRVYEFNYLAKSAPPDSVPDSPSFARNHPDNIHGQAYGFFGSGLMGLPNLPLAAKFPLSEYGASAGGDIASGRTAWFVAFDDFGMDPQRMLAAVASAQAHSTKSILPSNANVVSLSTLEARLDHRFSEHDRAFTRVRTGDARSSLAVPGSEGERPKLADTRHLKQISATAANTAELSPKTINETRAEFSSNEMSLPAGAQEIGIQSGLPTTRRDRVFEAANNVYRQAGGESLRFGGDFLFNQMAISFLESTMGRAGDSSFSQSSRGGGVYIQSQHRVRPDLVLTSGVRYQIQPVKGIETDTNNLAPQIGFAWSPSSHTVIRGGGAIYYDQLPLPAIAASADPESPANLQSSGTFTSRSATPAGLLASFTLLSPLIQNSYVETANFGIEQQLSAHTTVSSDYQFARGVQLALPMYRGALACAPTAACQSGKTFRASEMGTGAESSYRGFTVAFTQDPVRWGSYRVAFTRSMAEGSGTQDNESYISDDLRRVSITGALHTSLEPASGWRQRLSRGYTVSGSGDYSSRTEFAGMNFINLNARLTKTLSWGQHYRLDALAETLNSFERTNAAFGRSFANMGDRAANIFATYRSIASLQGPASTQLGLRLAF